MKVIYKLLQFLFKPDANHLKHRVLAIFIKAYYLVHFVLLK